MKGLPLPVHKPLCRLPWLRSPSGPMRPPPKCPPSPRTPTLPPGARGSRRAPPPRPVLPLFLLARMVAPPRFLQLREAAFSSLPGLPPRPPLAVALRPAVRHGAPRRGRSPRTGPPAAAPRGPSASGGVAAKGTSSRYGVRAFRHFPTESAKTRRPFRPPSSPSNRSVSLSQGFPFTAFTTFTTLP